MVEESDVVLLVLDARDPEGCRSRLLEEEVRRRRKFVRYEQELSCER